MYSALLLRDTFEILCYAFIIYTFCIWLKTDKTKNLLSYFLSYCAIIILAWTIELPTLTPFLFTYAPVILLLFIVLHEKTLQKNFVTLKTITPIQPSQEDWLDTLLSSALAVINNNKSITLVIENKDSLDYFLTAPFSINATVTKSIFTILLSSTSYDEKKIVWVTTQGQIRGINATWFTPKTDALSIKHTFFNKQDALFYSLQCDALILHINHFTRTFSLIVNGNEIVHIAVCDIKNVIKKHLFSSCSTQMKGTVRENNTTEKSLL